MNETFAEMLGLHQTDVEALSCIMRAEVQGDPLSAGALGSELRLTSGATTFLMNRLERAGLVQRTREASDQRKVVLRLTADGHDLAGAIYPPILQLSDGVMDQFTPAELEVVQRFLARTTTAMATHRSRLVSAASCKKDVPDIEKTKDTPID